jgi:hypothetical protein
VAVGSAGKYNHLAGDWIVPSVSGESGIPAYSSLWIGLDGLGDQNSNFCTDQTCVVVQDGTEQDVFWVTFGIPWEVVNYYAWHEFFPDQERPFPTFQVSAGDEIFSEVLFDGSTGWYWFEDISASTSVSQSESLSEALANAGWPSSATFVGNSAEWILERPALDRYLPELAQYSVSPGYPGALMSDAWVLSEGVWKTFNAEFNIQLSMYNVLYNGAEGDLLSSATDCGAGCISFLWLAFN